jgi:hypothetical protein
MHDHIEAYLDSIKERFVTDPIVTSFHVIRERSTWVDGHLRVRLTLADGSHLESKPVTGDKCGHRVIAQGTVVQDYFYRV